MKNGCYRCQEIIACSTAGSIAAPSGADLHGSYGRGKHTALNETGYIVSEKWEESGDRRTQ